MFGLLFNQEALSNSSFLECSRGAGGYYSDLVPRRRHRSAPCAYLPELAPRIRFGTKVVAMDQSDHDVTLVPQPGNVGRSARTTRCSPFLSRCCATSKCSRPSHVTSSDPTTPLRRVGQGVPASWRRFWEEDDVAGGGTVTDLAVRNVYYLDHGRDIGAG
jgi:monoamine oxidase